MHVSEPHVAAAITVCQALVVKAEQVQDGRPHVVDVADAVDGAVAELIGRAVRGASPAAASREEDAEAERVVIAAVRSL